MSVPIVQQFNVRSEGPVLPWLRLMADPGQMSHYAEREVEGVPRLVLFWSNAPDAFPLIGTRATPHGGWRGPTVEQVAGMIEAWLATVEYPDRPDTDGSLNKGWRLTNDGCNGWSYAHLVVEPHWQVYGK